MKGMGAAIVCFVLAVATAGVQAGVISSASFFSSLSYTEISFEYYSDGSPVNLDEGQVTTMYYDEYEASDGVWFEYKPEGDLEEMTYVNNSGPDFEAAQEIGGSMEIAFPGATEDSFTMVFVDELSVRSFGFWVVNNNTVETGVTFTAKNDSGVVLETVSLEGALIDGTIGVADYGFMGIWADEDIRRVDITKDACILDNLTFSEEIPEPAGVVLLAAASLAALRRRRVSRAAGAYRAR